MHTVNVKPEDFFQALADPTRIRVVRLLASTGEESCLCELVDSLLEPQYKLSRHVKILRQAGLLSVEKSGRWVYHRLVTNVPYLLLLYEMVQLAHVHHLTMVSCNHYLLAHLHQMPSVYHTQLYQYP